MESLLKKLKKHVECSICLDDFTNPKTIACFHTFCCECIKKYALLSQTGGQFRCPECQTQIGIPEGNRFDQLPTSFHHNSLLSLLAVLQSGDGSEISCGVCKKKSIKTCYCFDCEKLLCSDCANAHTDHAIEPLEKAADGGRANILAGAELMKQKYQSFSDAIRQFEETAANLETNITAAKRQVSRAAKEMIAAIHERERVVIMALENARESRMEKLDAAKRQVEILAKQINQTAEFASELVQRSSSADIMQNKRNLEEQFQELGKTALPALPVGPLIKFISTCTPDDASLGFISETDPNRSTVEGLGQYFQAGVEAEISICPKTHDGQISNSQHEDRVEVLVEPADQLESLIINEKGFSNFQVKFVPKLPGAYQISVKINDENLSQSPFTIDVFERLLEIQGELELENEVLKNPAGIAVNRKGLIAVADHEKHCILIFNKEGEYVRKLGCYGNQPGELCGPADVTFINDDEILVADECNHRIQHFNICTGYCVNIFGKKGTGKGEFKDPFSVCMDSQGHVIVAEYTNNRVQVLTRYGAPVLKFEGGATEKLSHPVDCICHDNTFIVCDSENRCLKVFDSSGRFLRKIGKKGKGDGEFTWPSGLCVDKHGNLLVCDAGSGRVQQFTIEGHFTGETIDELEGPQGITTMPDGRILLSNWNAKEVLILK